MAGYTIAIQKDSPIFKLYQKLKADGVKDDDLDTGYPETDYVNKTRKIAHQGDQVINETEVLNYALENYERFQLAIKEIIGGVVPWSLDDLNPATDFDAQVRDKVGCALNAFQKILAEKGFKAGTDRYNELLALSLFAFTLASQPAGDAKAPIPKTIRQELAQEGLSQVEDYLARNGGLALGAKKNDCVLEAMALQALAAGCGHCTEQSSVLYSVLRAAGLKANFLYVKSGVTANQKLGAEPGMLHVAVSVKLNKKRRIFDPTFQKANAEPFYKSRKFAWWFELTPTEFLIDHLINLGNDYARRGEPGQAVRLLQGAIRLDPNSLIAHMNLGDAYTRTGEPDLAIAEDETAVKIDPRSAEAYMNLGVAYDRKGDLDRSIAELKTAIKLEPDFAEAHFNLGFEYLRQHRWDLAIAENREAIRLEPKYADAHNNLGISYAQKGELDRPLAQYLKAVALNPNHADALNNLGDAYTAKAAQYTKVNDRAGVLRLCRKALEAYERASRAGKFVPPGTFQTLRKTIKALEELKSSSN